MFCSSDSPKAPPYLLRHLEAEVRESKHPGPIRLLKHKTRVGFLTLEIWLTIFLWWFLTDTNASLVSLQQHFNTAMPSSFPRILKQCNTEVPVCGFTLCYSSMRDMICKSVCSVVLNWSGLALTKILLLWSPLLAQKQHELNPQLQFYNIYIKRKMLWVLKSDLLLDK